MTTAKPRYCVGTHFVDCGRCYGRPSVCVWKPGRFAASCEGFKTVKAARDWAKKKGVTLSKDCR